MTSRDLPYDLLVYNIVSRGLSRLYKKEYVTTTKNNLDI